MAEAGRGRDVKMRGPVRQEVADGTELSLVAVLYHSRNEQDVQHDVQAEPRDVKKYILHFFGGDQHELQQELGAVSKYEDGRGNPMQPYLEEHPDGLPCTPYSIPVRMRHSLEVAVQHPPNCFVKFHSPCQIDRDKFKNRPINRLQNTVTVEFSIVRQSEIREPFCEETFSVHLDSDIESVVKKYAIYSCQPRI